MRGRRAVLAALAVLAAALPAAAEAEAKGAPVGKCRAAAPVVVPSGGSATLALDCRQALGGRVVGRVVGARHRASTKITREPRLGVLRQMRPASGRVRYGAQPGLAGRDAVGFLVESDTGRRYRGTIEVLVLAAAGGPAPAPAPPAGISPPGADPAPQPGPIDPGPATPRPEGDGLPARLPDVPASVAASTKAWAPTAYDTCPKALHERFSVIGPDGRRYPTWHPPTVIDPATGQRCTFGHEHGADPRASDIYDWVAGHFAAPGYEAYAGIPFGVAAEALNGYAAATPGTATRSEDHVGYKVDVADDVKLTGPDGAATGVTCDYLTVVHQGTHSPDALSNNAHELLYATRCDDGTALISSTLSRFGDPGFYERSCEPAARIETIDNGYPDGGGSRLIPDRICVERDVLVPPGRTTSVWAMYEKWSSENELTTAGGQTLASFPTAFGVFNPSRYGAGGTSIGRTLPLCWEIALDGDRADGVDCTAATAGGTVATPPSFEDPASPFDGTRRDFYLAGTAVENGGGVERVWTDPYGGNASAVPFPGSICQLVAPLDNADGQTRVQVFGRGRSYDAEGVHAPN